jgi:hypothetical protein
MAARKSTKKKRKIEEKTEKTAKTERPQETEAEKAAERFVEDLLIRGEAVYPDEHGELPPGATHEIVEEPGDGKPPKVRRRRFSMT